MSAQLPLFDQRTIRPRTKVPIDTKLVMSGKAAYDRGDMKGAAEIMRELRYKLEAYCARINSK